MSYYIIGNVLLWEEKKKKNIDHFQKKTQKNQKPYSCWKVQHPQTWSRYVNMLDHLRERCLYTYKVTCRQRLKEGGISSYKYGWSTHPPLLNLPNNQKLRPTSKPRASTRNLCPERKRCQTKRKERNVLDGGRLRRPDSALKWSGGRRALWVQYADDRYGWN